MGIPVTKVTKNQSYPVDGYTETVEWVLMQCTNVDGNNNKYYCMEIQHNPTSGDHRIYTEYGRLGNSPARDLRVNLSLSEAQKEFERLKKAKGRPKTKKSAAGKYTEKYEVVDVPAPSVGSPNIRVSQGGSVTKTGSGGSRDFMDAFSRMDYDSTTQGLLKSLLNANVHNIESKTSITISRNGLETALGPITVPHIETARGVLNDLAGIGDLEPDNPQVRLLNTKYFSMVPRQFGSKIDESDMILTGDIINEELDLLSGMEAAVKVGSSDNNEDKTPDLGLKIELVTDNKLSKQVISQFEKTRKHNDVANWKPKRVYGVHNVNESKVYRNPVPTGPEYDLFHGSAESNILSIMMNGYYVPPSNAQHVTGRMFGNGVYGASCSTKAFRYAVGLWGGGRSRNGKAYCFVVRFAMGKIYECTSPQTRGAPSGYHSIHAKAGHSLINDEYIVYNTNQTRNLYLIELEQ